MNQITKITLLLLTVGAGISIYYFKQSSNDTEPVSPEVASSDGRDTEDLKAALIEKVKMEPKTVEKIAEPMAEASTPMIAEAQTPAEIFPRQSAPDLNAAQLSPELSRTYNNYSALRTESFRNPDSTMNREVVADLESIRMERNLNK